MTFSRAASASKNAWALAPAAFLLAAAEAGSFALLAAARPGTCGYRKRAIENAGDLRESTGIVRFAPCSLGIAACCRLEVGGKLHLAPSKQASALVV